MEKSKEMYDRTITQIADVMFMIPYYISKEPADNEVNLITQVIKEQLDDLSTLFNKTEKDLQRDIQIAMMKISVEDAEEAFDLRGKNLLH